MYIIREVFTAKPGQASKLAALFKKMDMGNSKTRIMTDMVGPYNTVIMEMEVESLAGWEKEMLSYRTGKAKTKMSPEVQEEMKKYTEMYTHGQREIFQIFEGKK